MLMNGIKEAFLELIEVFGMEDLKFLVYILVVCFFTRCKIKKASKIKINDLSVSSFKIYQFLLNLKNMIELLKAEGFDFSQLSDEFDVEVVLEFLNKVVEIADDEHLKE